MHKEDEVEELQSDHYLIVFVVRAEFKSASTYEECQKAKSKCKSLLNFRDFLVFVSRT